VNDAATMSNPATTEFGLAELLHELWRAKIVIACVMVVCAAAGATFGLLSDKVYEASVTISPVLEEPGGGRLGGLSSLASQYGGLASLAGISLPGKDKKDESLAVLQSELLTEAYIRDNDLLPVLYSKQWDAVARVWKTRHPPTVWKANQYFKKTIRQVSEDRKSGLVMLSIRWKDARVAAKWANDLVKITNDYLRTKAIDESERNMRYLNEQASKGSVVEVQKLVYSMLQDEINKEMIAKGREEYALKVIDPAFVPERASSPGPWMLGAVGLAFGGVVSALVAFVRRVLRGPRVA
jgi:uncharacterized protein involved in exopolysaccharide biosynthesis